MKRFEQWAGVGWPTAWNKALGIQEAEGVVVWPIVDRETSGPIDGFPTHEQWFAVAFNSADQEVITRALNAIQS